VKPRPEDAAITYNKADLDDIGAVRKATPTVQDIAASCGAEVREEVNQFGRREVVASVPAAAAFEAMRPSWRKDTERVGNREAKVARATLVDRDGRKKVVPAYAAEGIARNGKLHEVPHWGRCSERVVTHRDGTVSLEVRDEKGLQMVLNHATWDEYDAYRLEHGFRRVANGGCLGGVT
jgi:hypothetical protein